jgi:NTE family protein
MSKYIILLFFFCTNLVCAQQTKKPKIAVVLSGGGAKGVAHIPLLQALDSIGIVPDLIVGTSMGSILGGLYAMGYSGNQIAAISREANWNQLLGGKTSLRNVSIEEKSEFAKYLVDFDIKKGKPKVKSALLNDQNLREFITVYTHPSYSVLDFDKLPIPFRAVATDIVNGEEVILKEGDLAVAMRASMSIPSVFKPVSYKDVLLVDGGILNNFPTDIAKKWGADIIIGSDVGGGMVPKEELEGITSVLFQSSMLISNKKNPESRKLCDILIDHLPNLTHSTGDFEASELIYKEGNIGTNLKLNELIALSKELKKYKQKKIATPLVNKKIVFDTIVYKGVSDNNLSLVQSRANIETDKEYSIQEVLKGVSRAMGTNLFDQINTSVVKKNNQLSLELLGEENSEHQLKTSLHYDGYRGIGVIINYNGRNVLGKSSRFLVTADIAEQPRFRVQYQKQFGENNSWWWRSELMGEFLNQEIYINGNFADELYYRYYQFDNEFNRNLNSLTSYVGVGFNYERTLLKPKAKPEINDNVLVLNKYHFNNLEINAHYVYNTLNTVFFAKNGSLFKAKIVRSLYTDVEVDSDSEQVGKINGSTNDITKLILSYENRIPMHEKLSLVFNANANFIFEDNIQSNELSFDDYGYGAKYFLGGNLISPRQNSIAFPGLRENELGVNQFIKLDVGFQFNPQSNLYLTPHLNYASVGFQGFETFIKSAFSSKGRWTDQFRTSNLFAIGATAAYDSYLGPINFDVSWVNDINKVRLFFSVGLFLTISD